MGCQPHDEGRAQSYLCKNYRCSGRLTVDAINSIPTNQPTMTESSFQVGGRQVRHVTNFKLAKDYDGRGT